MTASTYVNSRSSVLDRTARRIGLALLSWAHKREIRTTISREEQLRHFAQSRALEKQQHNDRTRLTRAF